MNLLPLAHRDAIERHLAGIMARPLGPLPSAEGLCGLLEGLHDFVLEGGKRIRPQLCAWTFLRAGEGRGDAPSGARGSAGPLPPALLDAACAWELFHLFLLVHDDLIDNADTRRGRPSLHRRLEAMLAAGSESSIDPFAAYGAHAPTAMASATATRATATAFATAHRPHAGGLEGAGQHLAIVAGDLLFSAALRLLHEADMPAEPYRRLLGLFSRVACTTGYGQALDICQSHAPWSAVREETLLREYHWKTAAYTFEGPMLSGALLAGAGEAALGPLSRFALLLGQAYQVHNDLLDLGREAHEGCDLIQGKRTLTLLRARRQMGDRQRGEFDRRLAELPRLNGQAVAAAEELRRAVLQTGAADQTRELIGDFLGQARAAAADPALPPPLAAGLAGLLDALVDDYFAAA